MPVDRTGRIVLFSVIGLVGLAMIASGSWMLISPQVFGNSGTQVVDLSSSTPIMDPFGTPTSADLFITPVTLTEPIAATKTHTAVPILTLTPSQTPTAWQVCPKTYYSHLRVGMRAMVTEDPPIPNRLRERADTNSKVIGMIQPGEEVDIIDGPGCSNEWVWWKVRLSNGLTGWTAEGENGEYWLIPVEP